MHLKGSPEAWNNPEDEASMFIWDAGIHLQNCMALQPKKNSHRCEYLKSQKWKTPF